MEINGLVVYSSRILDSYQSYNFRANFKVGRLQLLLSTNCDSLMLICPLFSQKQEGQTAHHLKSEAPTQSIMCCDNRMPSVRLLLTPCDNKAPEMLRRRE